MLHQPLGVFEPAAADQRVVPTTLQLAVAAALTAFLVFTDLYLAGVPLRVMATTSAVSFASSFAVAMLLADRRRPRSQGR